MSINAHVVKSTIVGALGGLLFGFDTAVISGTTSALTRTYHLTPALLGVTVSSALVGTVIGAMAAGIPGQKFGRRDSLRVMAIFYILSAIGCALAWNWHALIFFRFLGGLGIGGSSLPRPHVHRGDRAAPMARPPGGILPGQHRHRHSARLRIERRDRQHAPRRVRLALDVRHRRSAGAAFPGHALRHSPQSALAGHAIQSRRSPRSPPPHRRSPP